MQTNLETIPGTELQFEHYIPVHKSSPYPILFIHGMFGGSWQFYNCMEYAVRHGFEVYALNLEGHAPGQQVGQSSIEDYVENCLVMLRHMGRPTIAVGFSSGGLIVQKSIEQLSLREHEPLIKAAVFMASDMPGKMLFVKEMLRWYYIKAMKTKEPFWVRPEDSIPLFFNVTLEKNQHLGRFTQESGMVLRQIALGLVQVDEKEVTCPTLVLAFERDRITPPCLERRLKDKYGSDYEEVLGDHMTFMWSTVPMDQIVQWIEGQKLCYPEHLHQEPGEVCLRA